MKKFILRVFYKLKILKYLILTLKIEVNKNKVIIPINGGIGFNNLDISELWMIEILKFFHLDQRGVFIDVGANIGQTLIKYRTVYSKASYIGFEPNVSCVHYMESLIYQNKWSNIHIIPAGIAEKTELGILEHYTDEIVDSSASVVKNYREGSKVYKKDIVTLLDVSHVENIWKGKKISAIKIDVEGSELSVLKSFQNLINKDRPYVLVEVLPVYNDENYERLNNQIAIEEILNELDYMMYRIHKDSNNKLASIELVEAIGIHSNLEWCDYIFSPKELNLV